MCRSVAIVNFRGVNPPTAADSEPPIWCPWSWSWEESHGMWPGHSTPLDNPIKVKFQLGPQGMKTSPPGLGPVELLLQRASPHLEIQSLPRESMKNPGHVTWVSDYFYVWSHFYLQIHIFAWVVLNQVLCHLETNECQQGTHYLCHLGDISAASFADSLRSVRAHSRGHAQAHTASQSHFSFSIGGSWSIMNNRISTKA